MAQTPPEGRDADPTGSEEPSLAERLGFAPDDRVAVVHADDIGMCHAANEGAFEALENGPATCGSIMVPCPWFREAAARARRHSELDLGVHLTLNSEWEHYRWGPVAGRSAVPSLVDAQGCLPRTTMETVQRAKPDEVEIELRAQIDAALDAGIDVTHLDSHMGTVFVPPLVEIYARLGAEYRLPVFIVVPSKKVLRERGLESAQGLFQPVLDTLRGAGIPWLDAFDADSLSFADGEGRAHNLRRIRELKPGVSYLICHPAKGGEELSAIAPESHCRDFERRFYGGEEGRRALADAGVRTVGMRAIRALVRGESA
jgi:predicted glycoside hydrolase/deacetylase ChbG (UPF0249 family)